MASESQVCRENEEEVERLVALMGSGEWGADKAAIRLGNAGDRRALPYLVAQLKYVLCSPSPSSGEIAAALATIGDVEAVEPLACALGMMTKSAGPIDDERLYEPFRIAAADALGELVSPRARTALIGSLVDPSDTVRCAATKALAKLGESEWRKVVKGLDIHEDCVGLAESRDECAIIALENAVESSDGDLTFAASRALALIRNARGADRLCLALDETGWRARFTSLERVHGSNGVGRPGALLDRTGSLDGVNRKCLAAEALGELPSAEARTALIGSLIDYSGDVRCAAAKALAKLGESEWLGVVKGLDIHEDLAGLAESRDAYAIMALEKAVESSYGDVAFAASRALALIGNDHGADKLRLALDEAEWCASFTSHGEFIGTLLDDMVYDQSGSLDGVSRRHLAIDALCNLTNGVPRVVLKLRRLMGGRRR